MNFTIADYTSTSSITMDGTADSDGNKWLCVNHDGWDTPKVDLGSVALSTAHGGILTGNFLPPRPVSIEGVCTVPSRAASINARKKILAAALAFPTKLARLSAPSYNTGYSTYLDVATASQPKIKYLNAYGSFTFQLQFLAAFPVRLDIGSYSPLTMVSGSNSAVTSGGAPTPPTLTLGGSGGDVTITNTTATGAPSISFTGLPASAVIDFRRQTIMVGTTSYYEKLVGSGEWWWLLPGTNAITYSGPSATLSWQNAWW